jgi:hypothetical protein
LVEQRIRNAWVRGSNPLCGTNPHWSVPGTSFTDYTDGMVTLLPLRD